jgi:hypothetical protein
MSTHTTELMIYEKATTKRWLDLGRLGFPTTRPCHLALNIKTPASGCRRQRAVRRTFLAGNGRGSSRARAEPHQGFTRAGYR